MSNVVSNVLALVGLVLLVVAVFGAFGVWAGLAASGVVALAVAYAVHTWSPAGEVAG